MATPQANEAEDQMERGGVLEKARAYLGALGPGVITGASDDDPSGIGTYAQTGAQFGYTQLWTSLFTFPLMAVIQEMCARVGLQTGRGLAEIIRLYYPKPVLYFCVILLFAANTINIGADLGAMAASGQLLAGIPFYIWLGVVAVLTTGLEILVSYKRYASVLRILTLSLLAYIFVVFVVPQDWGQAVRNTVVPTIQFDKDYLLNLVAILGTTISPYLFFWQASEEIEEEISRGKTSIRKRRGISPVELKWMRADVAIGMLFSNLVMWFIIVTTASTLFQNHITDIDSATRAAEALKPIAGSFASALFAAGIIGTGLLAVPVLAGSSAYAIAETFHFREGLYLRFRQARPFYAVIALSTLVGAAINLSGINPIQALYYTAVFNGLAAPPLLVIIMLVSNNRKIMKDKVNGRWSNILGWTTTTCMTVAAAALLWALATGS
jgi:NRAMP (natural resistance-associated macrophage protein)-like metal ion transporter